MTDALRFYGEPSDPGYQRVNVVVPDFVSTVPAPEKGEIYFQSIGSSFQGFRFSNLYLTDYELPDWILDAVIEQVSAQKSQNSKLIADASRTLEEVGECAVKHGCSPVFYLHKLGLLTNACIAGGVYLDRDDVDLMVQQNASVILTPTADAGCGNGIPPLRMYLDRGLNVMLGTGGSLYNPQKNIRYEAEVLRLLVNGVMCGEVINNKDIKRILEKK